MKLLSTMSLMLLSNTALAHVGDHQGFWHDHGLGAQVLILLSILSVAYIFLTRGASVIGFSLKKSKTNHARPTTNDRSGTI